MDTDPAKIRAALTASCGAMGSLASGQGPQKWHRGVMRININCYLRAREAANNLNSGKEAANNLNSEASGAVIVDWFYDAAVSGADPIEVRPGFAHLLARIADNGVRTIIVET